MAKSDEITSPPAFGVEITSGGRAYDVQDTPREAPSLSPTRAAMKASARRRSNIAWASVATLLVAVGVWAWLSNPLALAPSDALARVNGEFIYERDVARELDLIRASAAMKGAEAASLPSAASALENLISRKLTVQDARKAGVSVSEGELSRALAITLEEGKFSEADFVKTLAKYNRTLDDIKVSLSEALLVTRHIETNVIKGAKDADTRRNLENSWETALVQRAKIDRLKPAGSGPAPRVGSEAPDFALKTLDGVEVKLSSLRGRPVMVNFWATWCPPCRAEIPEIVGLYRDTAGGDKYEILGIATQVQSDRETIRAFRDEFNMAFPIVPDVDSRVTSLYHVLPIPTTFFVDKEGIIRDMRVGVVDRETMERWLLGE